MEIVLWGFIVLSICPWILIALLQILADDRASRQRYDFIHKLTSTLGEKILTLQRGVKFQYTGELD